MRELNPQLAELNSKKVVVLDTLNNEKITYSSITEAALNLKCAKSTISKILIDKNDTNELKLLKKRYFVSYTEEKLNEKIINRSAENLENLKRNRILTYKMAYKL